MATGLSGVFSSIDTDVLVARSIAIEGIPLSRMVAKKSTYETKKVVISSIETRFGHLQDMVEQLDTIAELRAVSSSTTDNDVVGVTAGEGATEGTYEIEINQLATSERHVHSGIVTKDTALGPAAQFVYTYDGEQRTIQTTDTTTLEELAGLINNDSGNPGVTASVLEYDVGGAGTQVFHLVLAGNDSGSDYQITIDAGTTVTGLDSGWSQTLEAVDAEIKIDGYPTGAGEYISRSTNSITDVIPGVTLALRDIGTETVSMTRSTTALKTNLSNLAEIYNGIVETIENYTGYDEETGQAGALQGDSTLNGLITRIRGAMTGLLTGFDSDNDTHMMAAQIGLEIDRHGEMTFDSSTFDTAVEADYQSVLEVIGAAGQGSTDNASLQFSKAESITEAGTYEVEITYDGAGAIVADATTRIRKLGETTWNEATVSGMTVSGMLGQAEEGLTLDVLSGGTSETISYEVYVKKGMAGTVVDLLDTIMDEIDGVFVTKKSQIDDAVADLSDRIDDLEERLLKKEELLLAKYARMETLLAQMDAQRGAFEAMMSSIEAMNNSSFSSNN